MKLRHILAALGLAVCGSGALAQSLQDVKAIKPAADELKWQRISWVLDLAEGERAARKEGRPVFLWVTGDDPLERC